MSSRLVPLSKKLLDDDDEVNLSIALDGISLSSLMKPGMKPNAWGKFVWLLIHAVDAAIALIETFTDDMLQIVLRWLNKIFRTLPCFTCRTHIEERRMRIPLEENKTREELSIWLAEAHNAINHDFNCTKGDTTSYKYKDPIKMAQEIKKTHTSSTYAKVCKAKLNGSEKKNKLHKPIMDPRYSKNLHLFLNEVSPELLFHALFRSHYYLFEHYPDEHLEYKEVIEVRQNTKEQFYDLLDILEFCETVNQKCLKVIRRTFKTAEAAGTIWSSAANLTKALHQAEKTMFPNSTVKYSERMRIVRESLVMEEKEKKTNKGTKKGKEMAIGAVVKAVVGTVAKAVVDVNESKETKMPKETKKPKKALINSEALLASRPRTRSQSMR